MKKTVLTVLMVSMLAGCGLPSGLYSPRQAELQSIAAQSRTSLKALNAGIQSYFKSQVRTGKMSKAEYLAEPVAKLVAYYHAQAANSFITLDTNGDMVLTPDELSEANGLVPFSFADRAKRGHVTFTQYEEAIGGAIAKGLIVPTLPTPPAPATGSVTPTPASGSIIPPAATGSTQPPVKPSFGY